MWGYLSQFWDSVATTTLSAWEYSVGYFQSIGNAVAGAIGDLFQTVIHYYLDANVFLYWFFVNILYIFGQIFKPIQFFFQIIISFVYKSFDNPILPNFGTSFSTSSLIVLNSIPFWSEIKILLTLIILIAFGIGILKLFLKT
jgi:hypothetical protein